MTKQEIFEQGLDYFAEDPETRRCSIEGACYYHPATIGKTKEQSEGCWVGRLLTEEQALSWDDNARPTIGIKTAIKEGLPHPLWMEKRNMLNFLQDCQNLHDTEFMWEKSGLSSRGKVYAKDIIHKYNLEITPTIAKWLN